MKRHLFTLATAAAFTLAPTSWAATELFTISLTPEGGEGRTGSGSGTLTFDTDANTLTFDNIIWSGTSGNSSLAHIHGPSDPFPDTAGVIYNLAPFTTFGDTEGSFNGTLNLVDPMAGISLVDQLSQLRGGQWYINIHTETFGAGEIRGTITAVPEPSTWALIGLGSAALLWRAKRPRRSAS
jgi:hypothetical protein